MLVAVLALFVALGGTAIAVKRNSVGSKQIKKGAVRSVDLKNDGIKGKDVDEDTLAGVGQGAVIGRINGLTSAPLEFGSPSGTSSSVPPAAMEQVEFVSPVAGIASSLTVHLTNAPPGDSAREFFLTINGESSDLACGIAGGSDCTSGARTATVKQGDRLAIAEQTEAAPPPPTDALFGWQLIQQP
jgi:hypothetical protein